MEETLKKEIVSELQDALDLLEMGLSPFKGLRMGSKMLGLVIQRFEDFTDRTYVVQEVIQILSALRASTDYTPLLGSGYEKLPHTADLERIINQTKQALAVMEADEQNAQGN